jgi:hypothetical protein
MGLLKDRPHDDQAVHDGGRRSERGMAYLETLMVLPIVLTLIAGLADFSFVFKAFLVAGNAASEAARTATMSSAEFCDSATQRAAAEASAQQVLELGGVTPDQITNIHVDHTELGSDLCDPGMVGVEIEVNRDLEFLNLWFNRISPLPPIDFSATATALNENGN